MDSLNERFIVLDTETTGRQIQTDRVVDIGCVEIIGRTISGKTYQTYLNPERNMPVEAFKIHGLSDAFLADKPKFFEIAQEFLDFIAGAKLIIHNAAFDTQFLEMELKRASMSPLNQSVAGVIDTLVLSKKAFPGLQVNLNKMCERFGIDVSKRQLHGALLDAQLTAELYLRLTRKQETLDLFNEEETSPVFKSLGEVNIKVIKATQEECDSHHALLKDIEKQNKGKLTVWNDTQGSAE